MSEKYCSTQKALLIGGGVICVAIVIVAAVCMTRETYTPMSPIWQYGSMNNVSDDPDSKKCSGKKWQNH